MTQFPHFKKFTLMKLSKCCNAQVIYDMLYTINKAACGRCGQECELMEQSKSTASDSAKSAIAVLNDVYGKDPRSTDVFYPLSTILEAMETYTSQKDAQIQALTKEVEELKKEYLDVYKHRDQLLNKNKMLQEASNKMTEALNNITKEIDNQNPTHETIWRIAIEGTKEWEKLNK